MPVMMYGPYNRCLPFSIISWIGCIVVTFLFSKNNILWILLPSLCIVSYYIVVCCKFMIDSVENVRQKQDEFWKQCEDLLIPIKSEEMNPEEECVICYHSFLRPEKTFQAVKIWCACKTSVYHRGCIQNWFKKQSTCPVCRIDLRSRIHTFRE